MNNFKKQWLKPQWQKKRLEILERDKFTCLQCGETTKTLNVHHNYYLKNKYPWEYPNSCYSTLCEDCHKENHDETLFNQIEYIAEIFYRLLDLHYNTEYLWNIYEKALFSCLQNKGTYGRIEYKNETIEISCSDSDKLTAYDILQEIIYNRLTFREAKDYINQQDIENEQFRNIQ